MHGSRRPVVRTWHGSVPAEQAEPFHRYLLAHAVAEMRDLEGFLGATVLHEPAGDRVRITLLTTWVDDAAVQRYAGDDLTVARDYPDDARFGLVPDPHVTHSELAYQLVAADAVDDRLEASGAPTASVEIVQPDGLDVPGTYSHVAVATGGRTVFVAGQMSDDADGNLVHAGDLPAQAQRVFANLGRALAAAGARPEQVARITIYVVGHRREYLPAIERARVALFGDHKPTDVLLGVETLAAPGYLIEVDATAVIQGDRPAR